MKLTGRKKQRIYRKKARKEYLRFTKNKKSTAKAIRKAVKEQLDT